MSTKRKELVVTDLDLIDEAFDRLPRIKAMAQGIANMSTSPTESAVDMGVLGYAIVSEASALLRSLQDLENSRKTEKAA